MKTLLVDMDPQKCIYDIWVNIEDAPISMADVLLDPEIEMKYNIFSEAYPRLNPTLNYAEERLHHEGKGYET